MKRNDLMSTHFRYRSQGPDFLHRNNLGLLGIWPDRTRLSNIDAKDLCDVRSIIAPERADGKLLKLRSAASQRCAISHRGEINGRAWFQGAPACAPHGGEPPCHRLAMVPPLGAARPARTDEWQTRVQERRSARIETRIGPDILAMVADDQQISMRTMTQHRRMMSQIY